MTVIVAQRGTATADGRDATSVINGAIEEGMASAYGYGALVHTTPATITADALRLEILTQAGAQLSNDFTRRNNLTFSVEHNGSGAIQFDTDLDSISSDNSIALDDPLLDPSNLVRVHFGDLPAWPYGVAEGYLTSAPPVKDDDTGRWKLQLSCPGTWDVLDLGVLWVPEGTTGDTREFSYTAGQTGPSWVPEEWGTPHGYLVKNSFRWKHRWPRGWPESQARWLWSTSPEKNGAVGTQKFVGSFTLTARKAVKFYAAGDDNLKLYLNGGRVKTKGRGAWKKTTIFTRVLKAGTYTVAAEVANMPGGDNKSGFIFAAAQLKASGAREKWLLRSSTSSFKVRTAGGYFGQVPLPPDGWYPAAVLYTHVQEAVARGVDFHSSIVPTYTTKVDSDGSAWSTKGPAEYDIGTTGAELGEKIRAGGIDAAMLPGLRLSSWKHRGFDLRATVKLTAPKTASWPSRVWARVRSIALVHHDTGWTETIGSQSVTDAFGRRELTVSAGGQDGDVQADVFGTDALTTAASPEETIEVSYSSADPHAPMPFRDYNVADIVNTETVGRVQAMKVMSIAGAEQDDKTVLFTIAGYPVD